MFSLSKKNVLMDGCVCDCREGDGRGEEVVLHVEGLEITRTEAGRTGQWGQGLFLLKMEEVGRKGERISLF